MMWPDKPRPREPLNPDPTGQVEIRTYYGRTQSDAAIEFKADAEFMASKGYQPVSQSWADGRPGAGRILSLGLLAGAMRPDGTLTVTYRRGSDESSDGQKTCPRCAESIKAAALVCRYCGHEFAGTSGV